MPGDNSAGGSGRTSVEADVHAFAVFLQRRDRRNVEREDGQLRAGRIVEGEQRAAGEKAARFRCVGRVNAFVQRGRHSLPERRCPADRTVAPAAFEASDAFCARSRAHAAVAAASASASAVREIVCFIKRLFEVEVEQHGPEAARIVDRCGRPQCSNASSECDGGVSRLGTKSIAVVTSIGTSPMTLRTPAGTGNPTRRCTPGRNCTRYGGPSPWKRSVTTCPPAKRGRSGTRKPATSRRAGARLRTSSVACGAIQQHENALEPSTYKPSNSVEPSPRLLGTATSGGAIVSWMRKFDVSYAASRGPHATSANAQAIAGCNQPGRLRARGRAKGR